MKRNNMLLADQIRNKLTGKCLTAIATEAFINALPFNKSDLVTECNNLSAYAAKVVGKMHPETLLNRAMEATSGNQKAHLYVQTLNEAIESVVDIATKRIVNEALISDTPTPEIVAQAKLNSDETEKLVAASNKAGTDAVAKLVKDTMIDVIKDEKTAYETAAKLREEVKDVIRKEREDLNSELEKDALESYFNLVLDPTDVRDHISVFSKMQDVCMEAILHSNENYAGEIPYATMEKITLESTFPYFDLSSRSMIEELNSALVVTESALNVECEEDIDCKKKKVAKTAFICTICIMTLLQTLKSMHLAKPELADVKNFIEDSTNIKKLTNVNLANIEDKVNSVINDSKKSVALGAYNAIELSQAKESLEKAKSIIEKIPCNESEMNHSSKIINKINSTLEAINELPPRINEKVDTGFFVNRLREENLANLEHGVKLLSQKPAVHVIYVAVRNDDKADKQSVVDVELRGNANTGACVGTYMVKINVHPDFGNTLAEIIKECANYCDLGNKPVKMYFTDSGYAVPLKG